MVEYKQWDKALAHRKSTMAFTIEDRNRVRDWILVQENPATTKDISQGTGIKSSRLYRHLDNLHAQGVISRGRWPGYNGILWGKPQQILQSLSPEEGIFPSNNGRPTTQGNLEARDAVLTFILAQGAPVLTRDIAHETGIAPARVNRFLAYWHGQGKIGRYDMGSRNGSLWGSPELIAQIPLRLRRTERGRPRKVEPFGSFHGEGEAGLLAAILSSAIEALQGEERRARQDAKAWLEQQSYPGEDIFSFRSICEALGLDSEHIREGIMERVG